MRFSNAEETSKTESSTESPFFHLREHAAQYAGPGREETSPQNLKAIAIGYFGPPDPVHPVPGGMWIAASMAVDKANLRGGYRGIPFRLVPAWSNGPWGAGASQLARLVYTERVWGIIGGVDGASTHLAEQIVAKARLVLVNPVASDKSVNLANVPWVFSLAPGDHLLAPMLTEEIARRLCDEPLVIVSGVDHDSRHFARETVKCLSDRSIAPARLLDYDPKTTKAQALAERAIGAKAAAAVLVGNARDSARLAKALREGGFSGQVFGGPAMGRRAFLDCAGAAAEGAIFPLLCSSGEKTRAFEKEFTDRAGHAPDFAAAYAYDATFLLVEAIDRAGLNRARIRDSVLQLAPWGGITGTVKWDPLGAALRPVRLGTVREGSLRLLAPVE